MSCDKAENKSNARGKKNTKALKDLNKMIEYIHAKIGFPSCMQIGHKQFPQTFANRPILPAKLPSQRAKPPWIPPRHTQGPQDVSNGLL